MAFGWPASSPAIDAAGRMKVIVLGSPALPLGTRVFDCRDGKTNNQQVNMRHTISVLVENKFGVLVRVAGLFSGRGFNIDTLNVAPTQDASASRMTIVTRGDDATVEQIVKQLNKLVDVIKVQDFRDEECIDRELVLVKVSVDSRSRAEVMQITDIFRAKIVDVQSDSLTIEITGNESKVEKFIELMKPFGVLDLTRTGKAALPRK
jgi:acetolactate synthase I/III small subunit